MAMHRRSEEGPILLIVELLDAFHPTYLVCQLCVLYMSAVCCMS